MSEGGRKRVSEGGREGERGEGEREKGRGRERERGECLIMV